MHISIVNFSQMMTDGANNAITKYIMSNIVFPLTYLHFTLAGQGHVQFHCQYLANSDRQANIAIANKQKVACGLSITGFKLVLVFSKGQLGSLNGVIPKYFGLLIRAMMKLMVNFCLWTQCIAFLPLPIVGLFVCVCGVCVCIHMSRWQIRGNGLM